MLQKKDGVEVIKSLGKYQSKAGIVLMGSCGTRAIESAAKLEVNHGLSVADQLLKPF